MNEPYKYYAEWKTLDTEKVHTVWFHFWNSKIICTTKKDTKKHSLVIKNVLCLPNDVGYTNVCASMVPKWFKETQDLSISLCINYTS